MQTVPHIFRYGKADGGGQAAFWSRRLGICSSQTGETSLRAGQRNSAAHENHRDVPQPQAGQYQREGACDFFDLSFELIPQSVSCLCHYSAPFLYWQFRHWCECVVVIKIFIFNMVTSIAFAPVVCRDVTQCLHAVAFQSDSNLCLPRSFDLFIKPLWKHRESPRQLPKPPHEWMSKHFFAQSMYILKMCRLHAYQWTCRWVGGAQTGTELWGSGRRRRCAELHVWEHLRCSSH